MSIIDKLFGNSDDKKGLEKKANNLVDVAKMTAISTLQPLLQEFPQLAQASQLKHWNFLSTILSVQNALLHLHEYASGSVADKIKQIILDDLAKSYPQSTRFLQDLKGFLSQANSGSKDVGGLWLLWNLTERKDIGNDHIIASKLNNVFSNFNTYWSSSSAFNQ